VTLLLVLLAVAALFIAGYGPTLWLLERRPNLPRGAAIPVVGLGCYIALSHWLASLGLNGRWISWLCLASFVLLAASVPRAKRLTPEEVRAAAPALAIACAGLLFAAWPLVCVGYDSYLAFGNTDAAFNLAAYEDMTTCRYGQTAPGATAFWPNAQFAHVFGVGYLGILLNVISGANILKLHDIIAASVLFAAPLSVFVFCLLSLAVPRRIALAATAAFAASSLLLYTFYLQSLGALTFMAMAPATLALWGAALQGAEKKLMAACGLLLAGTCFGYYASLPVLGLLLAAQAGVSLCRREVSIATLAQAGLIAAVIFGVCFPSLSLAIVRRTVTEATSSRLVASLQGPEILLSFAFALTEQLAGFFWGVLIPPLGMESVFAPPRPGFFVALAVGAAASVALVLTLVKPGWRLPPSVRIQVLLLLAVVGYFLARDNAYGVFKLAAWVNPVVFPCFVSGLLLWPRGSGRRRWAALGARMLVGAVVALNVFWCARLATSSLPWASSAGKSLTGMRATDLEAVRPLLEAAKAEGRILLATPDPVIQRWVLTYIRGREVSVVPYLSLSPEEPDSAEEIAARGASAARYLLTWSRPEQDIVIAPPLKSLRRSRAFQLLSLNEVTDLPVLGRGWYRLEQGAVGPAVSVRGFRWLRSDGEVILLKPSGEDLRLRLTLAAGYGRREPGRELTLSVDGREFDRISTLGFAHVVSRPFRGEGFLSRIRISLPDNAEPLPNPWGLFNRWVPKDGRRLNVAVSRIELLREREYRAWKTPCELDLTRPEQWEKTWLTGLHLDGWIAGQLQVLLGPCDHAQAIELRGFVPQAPGLRFPYRLSVLVNGLPLPPVYVAKPGHFAVSAPLPRGLPQRDSFEIVIQPSQSFIAAGDGRSLSVRVEGIGLRPTASVREPKRAMAQAAAAGRRFV